MESILSSCSSGGCGAKIGPGELSRVLKGLPVFQDLRLIVGFDSSDDAAVFKMNDNLAIVSTLDFFMPMVDDALTFGRIAAANALSDVYAMGGVPLFALNLVCYPERMPLDELGNILAGGAEKVQEAGAILCGGHSIYDKEIKYGLAVTGQIDPDRIWRNNTPKEGDRLILTKPLGVGIVMAALRGDIRDENAIDAALRSMQRLNKYAAEVMHHFPVNACTDITGFGLLTHAREMAGDSKTLTLYSSEIPYIPAAHDYAQEYLITAAAQRNRNFIQDYVDLDHIPFAVQELMLDPQTSGGLLISVPENYVSEALDAIQKVEPLAKIIGEVSSRSTLPLVIV